MRVLTQAERASVRSELGNLATPPDLRLFTQLIEWDACWLARALCEELLSLAPRLRLTVHDFQSERVTARRMGVMGIPALLPLPAGSSDARVRFLGVPLGHQFRVLLADLLEAGGAPSRLSEATRAQLATIRRPLHIRVFASADCPYSPRAVRLAHQLAFAHPLVQAEMVSVVEFPELADRFGVQSLPTVVVNDGVVQFEGALSEPEFCTQVFRAVPPRSSGPPSPNRPVGPGPVRGTTTPAPPVGSEGSGRPKMGQIRPGASAEPRRDSARPA